MGHDLREKNKDSNKLCVMIYHKKIKMSTNVIYFQFSIAYYFYYLKFEGILTMGYFLFLSVGATPLSVVLSLYSLLSLTCSPITKILHSKRKINLNQ